MNEPMSHEAVWSNCLSIFKDVVEVQHFKAWFEPIQSVSIKGSVLTIRVPSQFFYEYLESNYLELISKVLKKVIGNGAALEYEITISKCSNSGSSGASLNVPGKNVDYKSYNKKNEVDAPFIIGSEIKNPFVVSGMKKIQIDPQLNHNYTLDNFVEGEHNRVARLAGKEIALKLKAPTFNPLFVHSQVGLGKTHLVNAIGNECKKNFPDKIVLYVSTEKFITQFQHYARSGAINDFINFYQIIDVLIIDDIQNFSKAEKTQEVLFTIFNHLHQNNKQIILTSDCFAGDLVGVQERLISRFRWGLNVEIKTPDEDTRVKILANKCKNEGFIIQDYLLRYIAQNIVTNVRDLESILLSILAESSFNKKDIDLDLVGKCLKTFVKKNSSELSIDDIKNAVCDVLNVPVSQLAEKTRKSEIVHARQISMYFSKKMTVNTLKVIGEQFGGKDHTTVMHSCKMVENQISVDDNFKNFMQELQNKLHTLLL